jgi:uncharacterized protein
MPANLPPQYNEAEKAYREAKTPAEKIEALEHMLAIMPHHKGTDKLRAELRAKIAKISDEPAHKQGGSRAQLFNVRKEGAGQIVLVGAANSGKSALVSALTDARPRVADYPYTTKLPLPAMMSFENIKVQLVDLPAITLHEDQPWMRSVVRGADVLMIVVDLSVDPLSELDHVMQTLRTMRVEPVSGSSQRYTDEFMLLTRALIVANKIDAPNSLDNLDLLRLQAADQLRIVPVSATQGQGLEEFRRAAFRALDVVRVYTKAPGQDVDRSSPFVLKRGSTIDEAAVQVHKDLAVKLKYAVVWGSAKFEGQRVGRTYIVQDGDVVEFVAARRG